MHFENNQEKQELVSNKINSSDKSLSRSMIDENIFKNYKDETYLTLTEMSIISTVNQNSSYLIKYREMKRDTFISDEIKFYHKMFFRCLWMINYYFNSSMN